MRELMLKGTFFKSAEEFDDSVEKMLQEWDDVGVQFRVRVICARKPV